LIVRLFAWIFLRRFERGSTCYRQGNHKSQRGGDESTDRTLSEPGGSATIDFNTHRQKDVADGVYT
jgi:hypothetical protein